MTIDADTAACARCGRLLPMQSLLLNSAGTHTCHACQAHAESQSVNKKTVLNTALGPFALVILAYVLFIVPIMNLFLPILAGSVAAWHAVGGIRLYMDYNRRTDDHGVDQAAQIVLLITSILALLGALGVLLVQILVWGVFSQL
jgi:hypothetical protein